MIFIVLCILVNTALILVFRLFPRFNIDSFQAIVANYFTASFLGFQLAEQQFSFDFILHQPWTFYSIILGLLFVSLFYLISLTTVTFGVSVASVANKMSIVIPVMVAVILYNDALTQMQVAGVLIAIGAVMMVSYKKSSDQSLSISKQWHYALPVILFLGCGSIDALIGYLQLKFTSPQLSNEFILSTAFLFAALAGTTAYLILILSKKITYHRKSVLIGLLLGIPNFFSMYLVMKSLESGILNSSTFFPVNNMSIVVLGTCVSILVFKERLSKLNQLGIVLSILAIILIAFM
jgi:drug/metabolite transporter (DMT)-like permease